MPCIDEVIHLYITCYKQRFFCLILIRQIQIIYLMNIDEWRNKACSISLSFPIKELLLETYSPQPEHGGQFCFRFLIDKLPYVQAMEYCSAIKTFDTYTSLEKSQALRSVSQSQQITYSMIPFAWRSEKGKLLGQKADQQIPEVRDVGGSDYSGTAGGPSSGCWNCSVSCVVLCCQKAFF